MKQSSNQLIPRIIPCLDVSKGRVVKGTHFINLKDMGDPVELAINYENQGADELVFLDISASEENRPTALKQVSNIAKHLNIPFTVGGGLKTLTDVKSFLDAGADKVALNTTAVINPNMINQVASAYGSQSVVVAIDVKKENSLKEVYIYGGRTLVDNNFDDWCKEVADRGAGEILLTCMHKDGTASGFDNELIGEVAKSLNIQVIASGGAKTPNDFLQALNAGADACLAAGMFHSGQYTVTQVKEFLKKNNIPIR